MSEPEECGDHDVLLMLSSMLSSKEGFNNSGWDAAMMRGNNGCHSTMDVNISKEEWQITPQYQSEFGKYIYAYLTPFIIIIGMSPFCTKYILYFVKKRSLLL